MSRADIEKIISYLEERVVILKTKLNDVEYNDCEYEEIVNSIHQIENSISVFEEKIAVQA